MTEFIAFRASAMRHVLAEGPVWSAGKSRILWIDVEEGKVFVGRLDQKVIMRTHQYDFVGKVGTVIPGDDDSLVVAKHDRIIVVQADGGRSEGPILVPTDKNSRSNDGAVDPAGRLLVGTLALDEREHDESLYRWELDGSVTVIDSDLTLSNGIAWSPDGLLMYNTDTAPGIVWVRDYDVDTGACGQRREYIQIKGGSPDGICVDALGFVWVAIWGAGEVRSFAPGGEPRDVVKVAAPHVSSVAFVGDHLELLLITTASRDLSAAELTDYPDAGCLFLAEVKVSGVPTISWDSRALSAFAREPSLTSTT